jgi:hypothetical protein
MPPARRAHFVLEPAGVAASFAARGLHSVLLPWMLIAAAPASALSIGAVQGAALGAQALALALLGGLGDRLGARRIAVAGQLAASVPALGLALAGPGPALPLLAVYASASGAIWGLLSPARDALAAREVSGDLLRPTAGFTAAQFAGLLAGIALASRAEVEGARVLLAAQAARSRRSSVCSARAPSPCGRRSSPARRAVPRRPRWRSSSRSSRSARSLPPSRCVAPRCRATSAARCSPRTRRLRSRSARRA